MVKNPELPVLDLDVQKDVRFIARPFKMTQGDKGYVQPFRLTNGWREYDVTTSNLAFHATKPDGTIISIEHEPARFSNENGIWYLKLPEELAQAIGNVEAYLSVVDVENHIMASTTKFGYEITAEYGDDIPSNNYISAFEELEKKFQANVENSKNEVNKQIALTSEFKQRLTEQLNESAQKVSNWLSAKTTEVDNEIKSRIDALDALQEHFNHEYNEQVAKFNNKFTEINNDWTSQSADIQHDYETKLAEKLAQVEADKNSKLQEIQDAWNVQTAKQKENGDKVIKALSDKLVEISSKWIETKTGYNTQVADAIKKVQDGYNIIKADYDKAIEANKNIDLSQYYKKPEVDALVEKAGKVKSASINGGAKVEPDDAGNLALTVPKQDMSLYATTEYVDNKDRESLTIFQQVLNNYVTTGIFSSEMSEKADKTTVDNVNLVANSAKTIATDNSNRISELSDRITILEGNQPKFFDTYAEAEAYEKAHPGAIVGYKNS